VHITELGGEYFRFDEARQELRGERTGIRYALGTRVQVQVSRVDLDGRRIDFRLVTPGEDAVPRALREKQGERGDKPPKRHTAALLRAPQDKRPSGKAGRDAAGAKSARPRKGKR